jgi:hypothetical protein
MRGYLLFDVNGRKFLTFGSARRAYQAEPGDACLNAWHCLKGWRGIKLKASIRRELGIRS